jgi:hypothetical protein
MISAREALMTFAALAFVTCADSATPAQPQLQSPQQVQTALGTLNRVVHHTDRLIAAKNYARLPHENGELKEGMEALEKSIAKEPVAFRHVVEPLMNQVRVDSQSVADAAALHDDTKLSTTHAALADSVKAVITAFPANVQPAPVDVSTKNNADRAGK